MKKTLFFVIFIVSFFQYSVAYCTINDQWNKYCNYGKDCYEYFNQDWSHYYNCDGVVKYDPPPNNWEGEDVDNTIMVDEAIMVEPWYFIHRKVPKKMKTYNECYDEYWEWIAVVSGNCVCEKWYAIFDDIEDRSYCWSYFESVFSGVSIIGRIVFFAMIIGFGWFWISSIKKRLSKKK